MAQIPPHPSLGDQIPADRYPGLPTDQSAGAPADQPQDVTAARSVGKPAEQLLITTPADQSQPLPAAEPPAAMPTDRNRPLPAAEPPAVMPADRNRPLPAAEPPAVMPADRPRPVPAAEPPAVMPADQPRPVPTAEPPAVMPADRPRPVPAAEPLTTMPADQPRPVPAAEPLTTMPADQPRPVPAGEPPAAMPADQSRPVLAGEPPAAMPADQSRLVLAGEPPAMMPADRSRPVLAAKSLAAMPADRSLPVLAAKPPAAMPADQPVGHVHPASGAGPPPLTTNPSPATPSAYARPPASPTGLADRPRHPSAEHPRPAALPASPHGSCGPPPADAVSVADTVSLYGHVDSVSMYGTAESLLQDDGSSLGSDSELNGSTTSSQRTDKYGFLGGTQFCGRQESGITVDVARQREMKWLEMLRRWDKWVARRFEKVKLRCRKGIPSSLRGQAWQQLSHSKQLMEQNPGKFQDLDRQQGDPKWLDIIEKDLHRQFPFHEMFASRGGHGQQDLYRILKAYTIYRPEEGYCQAQAPVAAVLLMHMPAEQAFWCLVQICEKYLPGYYSAGLEAIQLDGEIFFALLRRVSPLAYRHLQKFKIDPILYMTEWFMCIYSRTLPWSTVLRVWDMFFCDGVKVIFKVGLVLLRYTLGSTDKLRDCQGMYETMEKLRSIPAQYLQEDFLVQEVTSLKVTEALIERENQRQRRRWTENRGELQHRPSRRLYGARAIGEELSRLNPPLSSSPSLLSLTASLASLRRGGREDRQLHQRLFRAPSPTHSVSSLVLGSMVAAPPPTGPAVSSPALCRPLPLPQPGPVVSEGLRPSLPSPTSSVATFGESGREEMKSDKEREKERARAVKERARAEKEQARAVKERARAAKERAHADKERARREAKEREREHRLIKTQHRKGAKKENGAKDGSATPGSTPAEPNSSSTILKDGYF